jgi:hypothetical protein
LFEKELREKKEMPMELIQGRGFGLEQSGAGSLRIVESEAEREAEMLGEREQAALPGGLAGWLVGLIRRHRDAPKARKQMRVVETLALGGRRQLILVACGSERFLVGSGADRVDSIVRVTLTGDEIWS